MSNQSHQPVELQAIAKLSERTNSDSQSAAIVARCGDTVYSNTPKEWFDGKLSEYEVFDLDVFGDVSILKRALCLNEEFKLTEATYERVQRYGGPEEGGWYYHTMHPTENCEDESEELNAYGEGFVKRLELFKDEWKNTEKPIWM